MKAMVLAAGLGSRLRPLTESTPKPLLPLGPYPLIVWNLLLLRKHGISEVMINLSYLGEQIRQTLGKGTQWHMHLSYSHEPSLLGTGGALKQVESFFKDEPFLVWNGDTVADVDVAHVVAQHRREAALATMVLRDDPDVDRWGVIETDRDNRVLRIKGKGRMTEATDEPPLRRMFAGVQVVDPRLLHPVPPGVCSSILDAYVFWLERGAAIAGYVFSGYWSDVGTVERYRRVQRDVASGIVSIPE